MSTSPEFCAEATAIDDARHAAYEALAAATTRGDLGLSDVEAMEAAMAALDARCEKLRRRFYPRRHKLIITCGAALTVSPTWRSRQVVWKRAPRHADEND